MTGRRMPSRRRARRRSRRVALLAALLCGVTPRPGAAQAVRTVDATPCRGCRLTWRLETRIGDPDNPDVMPDYPNSVALDSKGRVIATLRPPHAQIMVYAPDGRLLRALGRKGAGPGEFHSPVPVLVTAGDTIRAFDGANARQTVYAPSLQLVRTQTYALFGGVLAERADGRILGVSSMAGNRVHVLSADGRVEHAFDVSEARAVARASSLVDERGQLLVAASGPEHAWVAFAYRSEVHRWNLRGSAVATLVFPRAWFPAFDRPVAASSGQRPTPMILAIREDDEGLLWIATAVAATNWRDGLGPPNPNRSSPVRYPQRLRARVYDTMLEVIDPRTGRLVASSRFPGLVQFLLARRRLGVWRASPEGEPSLEVWQGILSPS